MPETVDKSFRVSRRDFIRAAGGGAALAAGLTAGAVPFAASRAAAQGAWDIEADIVVVGSGGAALSSAVFAQSLGSSVVVLEKADYVGGTTAKSGGVYWIPNNSLMREAGYEDPKEDALKYMARTSYPQLYAPDAPYLGLSEQEYALIEAFYDAGAAAIDRLTELGAQQSMLATVFDGSPTPDYYAQLPEDKAPLGRALQPQNADGSPGYGYQLVEQLQAYLNANNVPILTGHRVVAVVQNDEGAVIGVEATITSGDSATPSAVASPSAGESRVAVKANKAVIFGSGGFTQNPDMRVNFLRGPVFGGCAVITNEGDLVKIASDVGAELGNMANAFWAQVPLEQALSYSSTPSDVFLIPGDTSILVNKYGVRIVNETIQYNERTQSHFVWDPVAAEFPNLVEILIYDQRGADLVGGQYPIPSADDVDAPDLIKGETLEELAAAIDERLALLSEHIGGLRLAENFTENLAATIERYNGFARTGVDDDFHRGEAPISLAFFGPALEGNAFPNKTMYPISDTGPYYAILIGGGTLDTKGGPRVNTQAQILRPNGEPIPGLYGTGNCIASPAGQAYWGAGGTIGVGIVYGYLAALNANDEPVKTA